MISVQIILLIIIIIAMYVPVIETANMGVLNQLQSSSTNPIHMPYGYSPWLRPVMQRGMHFNNPRWSR
jgi:hypothetical protein